MIRAPAIRTAAPAPGRVMYAPARVPLRPGLATTTDTTKGAAEARVDRSVGVSCGKLRRPPRPPAAVYQATRHEADRWPRAATTTAIRSAYRAASPQPGPGSRIPGDPPLGWAWGRSKRTAPGVVT